MTYDNHDRDDREHAFTITCLNCGQERSNLDGDCQCGSSATSYSSADASRWNRYLDERRR